MAQWNVKPSTLVILSCLAFLMVLILVLPDVDLPDTAFHRGTSPVALHSEATAPPAVVTVTAALQVPDVAEEYQPLGEPGIPALRQDPNFVPILFRSIRR
jgi:hypothetical protein